MDAVDLEAVVVLAPGREARALVVADRAVRELDQRLRGVVDVHLAARRGSSGSGRSLTNVFSRPDTSTGSPTRCRDRSIVCERMSPSDPDPARAFSSRQTRGNFGIDDPVLQVDAAVVVDVADLPVVDELLGQRHRRAATVVVADHVDDAGLLDGGVHALGVGDGVGERLLAQDRLAASAAAIAIGACESPGVQMSTTSMSLRASTSCQLVACSSKPRRAGGLLDLRLGAADDDLQHRLERRVLEEPPDLAPGVRMRAAHEVVADHRDVQLALRHRSSSLRSSTRRARAPARGCPAPAAPRGGARTCRPRPRRSCGRRRSSPSGSASSRSLSWMRARGYSCSITSARVRDVELQAARARRAGGRASRRCGSAGRRADRASRCRAARARTARSASSRR